MKEQYNNYSIDALKEDIDKKERIIENNEKKIRIVDANSIETKTQGITVCSLLPHVGLSFGVAFNDNLAAMTGAVPCEFVPFIIMAGSLGIGTIAYSMLEHISKRKKYLKSVTDSSKELDIKYEKVKSSIEREKAQNRKKAIESAIDSIEVKQQLASELLEQDDIQNKNSSTSIDDIQTRIEQLTTLLDKKFQELDILSTQKVLQEKTYRIREKRTGAIEATTKGIISGMTTELYYMLPFIGLSAKVQMESINSFILCLMSSFALGTGASVGYQVKNNKDYQKIFNAINDDLKENSLPKVVTDSVEEKSKIIQKLKKTIKEITTILIDINESKQKLEEFTNCKTR